MRSNICFIENYNYLILRLKWSKIDIKYEGVSIIVAAIGDRACLIMALYTVLGRFLITKYASIPP
jgi:hypothetical protein